MISLFGGGLSGRLIPFVAELVEAVGLDLGNPVVVIIR